MSLEENTENNIVDGSNYVVDESDVNNPNATIFSQDDLTINGAGTLNVCANYNNAITSKDDLKISGGTINIISVGDGLRGKDSVTIKNDAVVTIDAGEDGIKSSNTEDEEKGYVLIEGGNIKIVSGDDGIHADNSLTINNGTIDITKSYEGIESKEIVINGGNIKVVSSDDGFNAAGGEVSSTTSNLGMGGMESTSSGNLTINGGYIYVDASGDGLDANGSITMTGGTAIVNGPENDGNGSLDYDSTFNMSGGLLIACGSSGMAQTISASSSQYCLGIYLSSTQSANTLVHIEDESGNELITFSPSKSYSSVVVCSPELAKGTTYKVYTCGSDSKTQTDGLYEEGGYSGGTLVDSATISSVVTTIGSYSQNRMGRFEGGRR